MSTQHWPIAMSAKSTKSIIGKLPQIKAARFNTTAAPSGYDTLTETASAGIGIFRLREPISINRSTASFDVFHTASGDLPNLPGTFEFDVDVISEPGEPLVLMGDILQQVPHVRVLTASATSSSRDTSEPVTKCIPISDTDKEKAGWLQDTMTRITRFMSFKRNWDSYGAAPIQMSIIARAFGIAMRLADVVVRSGVPLSEDPFVAPTSDGGVIFEIKNGPRELHITVLPKSADGYDLYRIDDASGEESETPATESELSEALSWIIQNR